MAKPAISLALKKRLTVKELSGPQETGYENCEVSKEGLLPNATSNVAMETNEQGRVFHSVEPRATEIYAKECSSLSAEPGGNHGNPPIAGAEDLHNNYTERFYYL